MSRLRRIENGSTIVALLIIMPFLILITAYFLQLATTSYRLSRGDQFQTYAQFATDAGIDYAVERVNTDNSWTGTASEIELHNDGTTRTTYLVSVTNVDDDNKTLTTTGKTYNPATSTTPKSTIVVKTDLRAVRSGNFSIVTGVGGLYMSNSAKIVGGDVLVNGEIRMSNTAQIGLTTNPVTVQVAHQICPVPATASFPRICNSGENGQPITINNSAHIYGEVRANNQTSTSGMTNPGLVASSGVASQSLPPYDRDAQKAAVATTITGSAASCNGSQTRTWAANTKITGDVSVSNNCVVTVMGNVWITGNFTTSNSAQVVVSNTLGSTMPTIMIDGTASFSNTSILKSNSSSTGFQILTYKSNASCSPDCADVTGTNLYNSRNLTTIQLNNTSSGPNTIFYARWSRVSVSNSGQIGAIVGQTIELNNTGTITFGTSVPGAGNTTWLVSGYRRSQ